MFFFLKTKISNFSNVIYTTSKNELKMMWLTRNTKVLDSFPLKNGKFMPVLCDQVTQCLGSLRISLVSVTNCYDESPSQEAKILWIILNLEHTHLFLPETDWLFSIKNSG